jgi:hypothetical protein
MLNSFFILWKISRPSLTRPAWQEAQRRADNVASSGTNPLSSISSNIVKASEAHPYKPRDKITELKEIILHSGHFRMKSLNQ